MSKTDVKIGQLFRNRRESAGLTQLHVSKLLGYESMQFVSLFERGLSKVPYDKIGQMFELFNMTRKEQKLIIDMLETEFRENLYSAIAEGKTKYRNATDRTK